MKIKIILSIATLLLSSSAYAGPLFITDQPQTENINRAEKRVNMRPPVSWVMTTYLANSSNPQDIFVVDIRVINEDLKNGKRVFIENKSGGESSITLSQPLEWGSNAELTLFSKEKIDIQNKISSENSLLNFSAKEVRLIDVKKLTYKRVFIACSKLIINNKEADQETINDLKEQRIFVYDLATGKPRFPS